MINSSVDASSLFKLLLILVAISFIPVATASQPEWSIVRPTNSPEFLYGVGQGKTRQIAIEAALVEIASAISINIQSKTDQTIVYANGKEQNIFNEKTSSEINQTQFSHYDVVRSQEIDNISWVLVAVNRSAMSKDLLGKISSLRAEVELRMRQFTHMSTLEKSQLTPKIKAMLNVLVEQITTLEALDKEFDPKSYREFILIQEESLRHIKNQMFVKIEAVSGFNNFANLLAASLTERDVKVVQQGSRQGKSTIAINGQITKSQIQNLYVTKVEVKIDAINEQGAVLKSYMKTLNGVSPSNYEAALSQANQNLFNLFLEDRVFESFGF